jgi:hypothetical protein
MRFKVERWSDSGQSVFTIRQGIRVLAEYPQTRC